MKGKGNVHWCGGSMDPITLFLISLPLSSLVALFPMTLYGIYMDLYFVWTHPSLKTSCPCNTTGKIKILFPWEPVKP